MTHSRAGLLFGSIALLAQLFLPSPVSAEVTFNEQVPISFGVFVPCANDGHGELVVFTGFQHQLVAITTDDAGGFHLVSLQANTHVVGTGAVTGDTYEATGVNHLNDNDSGNGATELTSVFRLNVVGIGKASNFQNYTLFHFTLTPSGMTVFVSDNWAVCR